MSVKNEQQDGMKASLGDLVTTGDGTATLRHPGIDEDYHSRDGARFETDTLYMERSGFRETLRGSCRGLGVLDVGLGLGFNALATIETWLAAPGPGDLQLLSLEINPDLVRELATGKPMWGETWGSEWCGYAQALREGQPGRWQANFAHPQGAGRLSWRVWVGDAAEGKWEEEAQSPWHFVWQDAFSPRKNPELWTNAWFARIKAGAAPDARLVTYSVSRVVKDGLTGAGWVYAIVPGGGTKRQWLAAALTPSHLASFT